MEGGARVYVKTLMLIKNRFKSNNKCLKLFTSIESIHLFLSCGLHDFPLGNCDFPVACPLGLDNLAVMETELRQNKDKN